jgi:hypothetical protein
MRCQGTFGRRLWQRLERLDLLTDPRPGPETSRSPPWVTVTDVVKRPTKAAREVSAQELRLGAAELREKIARWQPPTAPRALTLTAARPAPEHRAPVPRRCRTCAG